MNYSKTLIITILFLGMRLVVNAQCKAEFTTKTFFSEKDKGNGKIEITSTLSLANCSIKVYKIEGQVELVKTLETSIDKSITIENLQASYYVIKIEWNGTCSKTIGGLEGIRVLEKSSE